MNIPDRRSQALSASRRATTDGWCLRCPGEKQHVVVMDMPNTFTVGLAKSEYNEEDGDSAETTMSQKLDNNGTATNVTGIKIQLRERAGRPAN